MSTNQHLERPAHMRWNAERCMERRGPQWFDNGDEMCSTPRKMPPTLASLVRAFVQTSALAAPYEVSCARAGHGAPET